MHLKNSIKRQDYDFILKNTLQINIVKKTYKTGCFKGYLVKEFDENT
jgi:hypothetical protein